MNIADVIRNLIIRAKAEGVDQTAQSLKGLAQAHDQAGKSAQAHAQASESSARRQLSMDQAFERLERRFNTVARAQQDFSRVQSQVNAAVAQNPALQARANEVLALAAAHYGRASQAQNAFATGMRAIQDNAIAMAGRLGVLGSVLSSIGPAGVAAGAGIGLAAVGLSRFVGAVNDLADRAGKMVDLAQTTGLSTDALQALVKAGAQVGVEADKVGTSIERFTVQLEQLRKGSGDLYDAVRQVDQGLVDQLAGTRDAAEAWNLLSEAYRRADDRQKILISRGTFGQRNLGSGRLLRETADAGGLDAQIQKSRELGAIDEKRLQTLDQIGDRLNELRRSSIDRFLIRGAEHELKVAEDFYLTLNKIQDWVDSFNVSETWNQFIKDLNAAVFPETSAMMERRSRQAQPEAVPQSSPILPAPNLGPGIDIGITKYKEFLALLGPAATQAERLQLQILELGNAALKSGASQETYNRALTALNSQSMAGLRGRIADLQFESSILGKSRIEVAGLRAEWEALRTAREEAFAAGKGEEEIAEAMARQKEAMGEIVIAYRQAAEEAERQKQTIEESTARQQRLADACREEARAREASARAAQEAAEWARKTQFIPAGSYTLGKDIFMGSGGQFTQFNPAGYASTDPAYSFQAAQLQAGNLKLDTSGMLLNGGAIPFSAYKYTEQGFETLITNKVLKLGGSIDEAINKVFSAQRGISSEQVSVVQRLLQLQPEASQENTLERLISEVSRQPATLAREELLKQLRDQLAALTDSTDSLNDTMRDILSPLYGADPRTTRIGFRADSGVYQPNTPITDAMTGWPVLPGKASGGDFTVPGGYSSVDNMLLPVASGERIKVNRSDDRPPIVVNAPITINGMTGDRQDIRETSFQISQAMAAAVRQGMSRG